MDQEEAAEEYLEDLVKRSLVLVTKRKSNGKIKSCSIHDLVRDLCIRKAKEEKFLHFIDSYDGNKILLEGIKNQRRLAITHSDITRFTDIYCSSIRTILCFRHKGFSRFPCSDLRLLRLLHIVDAPSSFFPDELFELFYLKYLAFCCNSHTEYSFSVPAAVSNLQNLETLIISIAKTATVSLPWQIWRMPQLRHLVCFFFLPLRYPELLLENLQTFSVATTFVCNVQIVKRLPSLKKLGIFYCRNGYDADAELNNLVHLERLEKLKLAVCADFPDRATLKPVFPESLTLSRLELAWEDMSIIGSLPNLQVLKLRNFACKGYKWETSDGEFAELRYLVIEHSNLQYWITESSHFPRLRWLMLHRCWCLSEIPDSIGEIPTLEMIEVDERNELLVKSAKVIQEEQRDCGNDILRIRFKTRPAYCLA